MVQSLSRDTEEADLTVDGCLNAIETNEKKVCLWVWKLAAVKPTMELQKSTNNESFHIKNTKFV